MPRRARATGLALTVGLLFVVSGCGDDEKPIGSEQSATQGATADDDRYDEILSAIEVLDSADVEIDEVFTASDANQALGWHDGSSPYVFVDYTFDEVEETGSWCIQSEKGAYLTMSEPDDETMFLVGDGECNYDLEAAPIAAGDIGGGDDGDVLVVKGVDLVGERYRDIAATYPLVEEANSLSSRITGLLLRDENYEPPATLPAEATEWLPATYEVRDYATSGEEYSFCLVEADSGAWVFVQSDEDVVGKGASGAACTKAARTGSTAARATTVPTVGPAAGTSAVPPSASAAASADIDT